MKHGPVNEVMFVIRYNCKYLFHHCSKHKLLPHPPTLSADLNLPSEMFFFPSGQHPFKLFNICTDKMMFSRPHTPNKHVRRQMHTCVPASYNPAQPRIYLKQLPGALSWQTNHGTYTSHVSSEHTPHTCKPAHPSTHMSNKGQKRKRERQLARPFFFTRVPCVILNISDRRIPLSPKKKKTESLFHGRLMTSYHALGIMFTFPCMFKKR